MGWRLQFMSLLKPLKGNEVVKIFGGSEYEIEAIFVARPVKIAAPS